MLRHGSPDGIPTQKMARNTSKVLRAMGSVAVRELRIRLASCFQKPNDDRHAHLCDQLRVPQRY